MKFTDFIMSSTGKINEIINIRACRICLDSQSSRYIILQEKNGWFHLFEYCFGVKLKIEYQPRLICYKCAYKLKKFYAFKAKCNSSEEVWKYMTIVKCRIERIQLNDIKSSLTVVSPEPNKLFGHLGNDLSYCHNNSSNNSNDVETNSEDFDVVNYSDSKEIDVLIKNENIDSVHQVEQNEVFIKDETVIPQSSFKCRRCSKNYATKIWYIKHTDKCRTYKKILPNVNSQIEKAKSYSVATNKSKSFQNIENCQAVFQHLCGICKFSSTAFEDINKHLDEHWSNRDLQCMTCEFLAKDEAGLSAHRYNHYNLKSVSYVCHICQKKTKSQLTLQFHYRKDHLDKPGGLCSQQKCDKTYTCWRLWKKHEKLHSHPGYICDVCGQKYKYKHLIVAHLINHTNPSTHVCDVCGKIFRQMRNLKVHVKNVHKAADPVKCTHCERVFKNKFHLSIHHRRIAMKKTLKCEFCTKEYSMLSQLNSHLKSHSEERPHCCCICGSRYKAKSQLSIHMRNHTGDRPYKCVLCVKAFTSGAQLKVHTMSHTGLLPFKCLYCEKAFRCKKRLLGHCAVRHKPLELIN